MRNKISKEYRRIARKSSSNGPAARMLYKSLKRADKQLPTKALGKKRFVAAMDSLT